jgi:hypothetical protein
MTCSSGARRGPLEHQLGTASHSASGDVRDSSMFRRARTGNSGSTAVLLRIRVRHL